MSYEKAASLLSRGISKPSLYSVRIGGGKISDKANEYLDFFCYMTAIPSVSANTVTAVGQEYQGIVREVPGAIIYSKPFSIDIIENSDFLTYKAIRKWFEAIGGNINQAGGVSSTGRSIRMNYYNTYVSNIELTKLELPNSEVIKNKNPNSNEDFKSPLKVHFINAYPIEIGQIMLQSTSSDQGLIWSAKFTYESYRITDNSTFGYPSIPGLPGPLIPVLPPPS